MTFQVERAVPPLYIGSSERQYQGKKVPDSLKLYHIFNLLPPLRCARVQYSTTVPEETNSPQMNKLNTNSTRQLQVPGAFGVVVGPHSRVGGGGGYRKDRTREQEPWGRGSAKKNVARYLEVRRGRAASMTLRELRRLASPQVSQRTLPSVVGHLRLVVIVLTARICATCTAYCKRHPL